MSFQKADSRLNLLLTLDEKNPAFKEFLGNTAQKGWELIIKYNFLSEPFTSPYLLSFTPLVSGFAIVNIMPEGIPELLNSTSVEYVELPKEMFYQLDNALSASCIQKSSPFISTSVETGEGIIIAVIDSGIDYMHPDFINPDNTTRILSLWDQTLSTDDSSQKYGLGRIFSEEEINNAIRENDKNLVPSFDLSGHGTHVTGICAGNGRASLGKYTGVAPRASLLIVKLGSFSDSRTALTSHLMMALDWCINESVMRNMPLAINLSYGENFGPHDGLGLLDKYIGEIALIGRTCICIGTGNEGVRQRHAATKLSNNDRKSVELNISPFESSLSIQIWKNYYDECSIELVTSEGISTGILPVPGKSQILSLDAGNVSIFIYFGLPTPFTISQEIFIYVIPKKNPIQASPEDTLSEGFFSEDFPSEGFLSEGFLPEGLYTVNFYGDKIRTGEIDLWLPSASSLSATSRFITPEENTTLTIPSTSPLAISVGGYNSNTLSYSPFSGRGFTKGTHFIKPELSAPAVDIISTSPGGGYESRTGTSMAVPFVTGSCARLMEWGIKKGNDPYLYGERAKAFLIKGTEKIPAYSQYPNPSVGYGVLCLSNSYPYLN